MKYSTLCFLAFLFAISFANAQSNYKPGYIVTLDGDTTRGFVDYKEWNENPEKINFKGEQDSDGQIYNLSNISAFGIDGIDHFKKYYGRLSLGSVELGTLSRGLDTSYTIRTVFLREIVSGKKVKLFIYVDKLKERLFIAEGNAAPVELGYYVYLDERNTSQVKKSNFFTRQLIALALKYQPDNRRLNSEILEAGYREATIKNIVKQLNGTIDNNIGESAKRGGHRFYIGAGANLVNAKFNEVAKQPLKLAGATVNAGVDFYFNKNVGKWLLRAELGISQNSVNIQYSNTYMTDGYANVFKETQELGFKQLSVSLSPQVIYNLYNKDKLKIYLAGGFHISYNSFKDKVYAERKYVDDKLQSENKPDLRYEDVIPAFSVKAGALVNKQFEIYVGYLKQVQATTYPRVYDVGGRTITTFKEQVLTLSLYQFGINYIFGK